MSPFVCMSVSGISPFCFISAQIYSMSVSVADGAGRYFFFASFCLRLISATSFLMCAKSGGIAFFRMLSVAAVAHPLPARRAISLATAVVIYTEPSMPFHHGIIPLSSIISVSRFSIPAVSLRCSRALVYTAAATDKASSFFGFAASVMASAMSCSAFGVYLIVSLLSVEAFIRSCVMSFCKVDAPCSVKASVFVTRSLLLIIGMTCCSPSALPFSATAAILTTHALSQASARMPSKATVTVVSAGMTTVRLVSFAVFALLVGSICSVTFAFISWAVVFVTVVRMTVLSPSLRKRGMLGTTIRSFFTTQVVSTKQCLILRSCMKPYILHVVMLCGIVNESVIVPSSAADRHGEKNAVSPSSVLTMPVRSVVMSSAPAALPLSSGIFPLAAGISIFISSATASVSITASDITARAAIMFFVPLTNTCLIP